MATISFILSIPPTCFNLYWVCCLLRDFKNLDLLFCFIFYYYFCHYSTLHTFIYKRKKAITKAAKEIVQKELTENIIKLKHEKKDIGNGKYATWLNRAAFVVKEKHGKLYKRDYRGRQKRSFTPFAVHYEKMSNYLRETATNSAKIHSLARKYEYLRINEIQLRFLHFNQHSITLLGIHMRH